MSGSELGLLGLPQGERDRLIAAFVLLTAARGYDGLDPELLCRHAGVSAGSFQRHFPDLRDCFNAAWDRLEAIYLQRIASAYEGLEDWREKLRAGIGETLALIDAHPAPARFLTVEALAAGELGRTRQRELADRLAELLDRASASLDAPAQAPESASRWVLAMVFDRVYRHLASGSEARLSDQLPQLMFLAVSPYVGPEAGLEELRIATQ
jgi:AcrR family transcriptional regulator